MESNGIANKNMAPQLMFLYLLNSSLNFQQILILMSLPGELKF